MATSTWAPRPVAFRPCSAAMIAPNAYSPALRSAIDVPILAGSPSGSPVTANSPAAACTTVSYAGRARHGPVCPNPETDA
jgi:hypothetical protein